MEINAVIPVANQPANPGGFRTEILRNGWRPVQEKLAYLHRIGITRVFVLLPHGNATPGDGMSLDSLEYLRLPFGGNRAAFEVAERVQSDLAMWSLANCPGMEVVSYLGGPKECDILKLFQLPDDRESTRRGAMTGVFEACIEDLADYGHSIAMDAVSDLPEWMHAWVVGVEMRVQRKGGEFWWEAAPEPRGLPTNILLKETLFRRNEEQAHRVREAAPGSLVCRMMVSASDREKLQLVGATFEDLVKPIHDAGHIPVIGTEFIPEDLEHIEQLTGVIRTTAERRQKAGRV